MPVWDKDGGGNGGDGDGVGDACKRRVDVVGKRNWNRATLAAKPPKSSFVKCKLRSLARHKVDRTVMLFKEQLKGGKTHEQMQAW